MCPPFLSTATTHTTAATTPPHWFHVPSVCRQVVAHPVEPRVLQVDEILARGPAVLLHAGPEGRRGRPGNLLILAACDSRWEAADALLGLGADWAERALPGEELAWLAKDDEILEVRHPLGDVVEDPQDLRELTDGVVPSLVRAPVIAVRCEAAQGGVRGSV